MYMYRTCMLVAEDVLPPGPLVHNYNVVESVKNVQQIIREDTRWNIDTKYISTEHYSRFIDGHQKNGDKVI